LPGRILNLLLSDASNDVIRSEVEALNCAGFGSRDDSPLGHADFRDQLAAIVVRALGAASVAGLVVDGAGRVLSMTPMASQAITSEEVLAERTAGTAVMLNSCARSAVERFQVNPQLEGASAVIEASGGPLLLEIKRLWRDETGPAGQLLVLVVRHPSTRDPLADRLRVTFDLTPAEASVALALCTGKSPDEIAENRGVKIDTVRTQLRTLFSKLRVKRQAELVSLLLAYA